MHIGGGGRGLRVKIDKANFKRLINKNAIKPKIVEPPTPGNFPENFDPPRDFGKKISNSILIDWLT
jgi:hypothetical protein